MRKNRFDLLPIVFKTETKEYFITEKPNEFTQIERKKITFDVTLDLNTNTRTVIDSFSSKKRTFYFLTFQKEIAGLITIGNLNCRQVQIYIFQHLCDLERTLGDFLISKLNHDKIIEWIKVKSNPEKENDKYSGILKLYENLRELDLENKITEHLEISGTYWTKYNSINEIRKRIAHPTRSLLDKENTIEKLSKRLGKIDELLFTLNNN
jgi:hypothetical protein